MTTATLSPTEIAVRARWGRSVAAVLTGLMANVILSTATDLLLVAAGVFPPLSEFGAFSDSLLAVALFYRTAYGVLGCYITARLAPRRPLAHSLTLGCVGFAVGVVGALATWGVWTSWYSVAIIAVTLPSAWLGARLSRARPHS